MARLRLDLPGGPPPWRRDAGQPVRHRPGWPLRAGLLTSEPGSLDSPAVSSFGVSAVKVLRSFPGLRYLLLATRDDRSAMTEKAAQRPTRQDLDRVLERTRERIESVLRRHQCTSKEATGLLREAIVALAHRWSRVRDRDQWLLDRIEKAVRRAENPSLEELPDDEEPPS